MNLEQAFSLRDREIISLVGAGGKTTLLFALADELSIERKGIIVTTTTKIWEPAPSPSFSLFCSSQFPLVKEWVTGKLGRVPYLVVAREKLNNGKLRGIPPAWIEELESLPGVSFLITEADGAAGRSLKAAPLLGVDPGIEITEEFIARLLVHILRDKPIKARVIPFINKVDLPGCLEKGKSLARYLLSFKPLGIQRVVLGHARPSPPVKEILEKPKA